VAADEPMGIFEDDIVAAPTERKEHDRAKDADSHAELAEALHRYISYVSTPFDSIGAREVTLLGTVLSPNSTARGSPRDPLGAMLYSRKLYLANHAMWITPCGAARMLNITADCLKIPDTAIDQVTAPFCLPNAVNFGRMWYHFHHLSTSLIRCENNAVAWLPKDRLPSSGAPLWFTGFFWQDRQHVPGYLHGANNSVIAAREGARAADGHPETLRIKEEAMDSSLERELLSRCPRAKLSGPQVLMSKGAQLCDHSSWPGCGTHTGTWREA